MAVHLMALGWGEIAVKNLPIGPPGRVARRAGSLALRRGRRRGLRARPRPRRLRLHRAALLGHAPPPALPLVAAFLAAQPPGAVGLDVVCGNGKYLALCGHVALLGYDRSAALAGLARARTAAGTDDVLVADGLAARRGPVLT